MNNYELLPRSSVSSAVSSSISGDDAGDGQVRDEFPVWILAVGMAVVGGVAGWFVAPVVTVWMAQLWTLVIPAGDKVAWHLTRSMATVAYVSLTGAAVWGLLLSTKLVKSTVPAPLSLALHSALSWLGVALGGLHALLLLLDRYYTYSIGNLLIPFTGPYRPGWVGLGTISLYGLALVSASFFVRKWMGQRAWRLLHYLSFPLFILVTLHGLFAGTDSTQLGVEMMYLFSGTLVLLLTVWRIYTAIIATQKMPGSVHKAPTHKVGINKVGRTIAPQASSPPRTRALAEEL